MSETIDVFLSGLVTARESMQRQTDKIGEIMEKSNNTLLHIESNQNNVQTHLESTNAYNVSPQCEQSLVKVWEQFQQLVNSDTNAGAQSVLNSSLACRQRVEYLGSSVRKLVALCDTIAQLKLNVLQHQLTEDEEEDLYSD